VFDELVAYTRARGVDVAVRDMDPETPAEFDGPTITINERHDPEARSYYLVHSFGSIVGWAVDYDGTRAMYHELRAAKKAKDDDPDRLERAIRAFRSFEERASEYAVCALREAGFEAAIPAYTEFFRADAEAMTIFHREGKAPPWPEFFKSWKERASRGELDVRPYAPRPIPEFTVPRIEHQEVVQERD
jgi:hypothetical protein